MPISNNATTGPTWPYLTQDPSTGAANSIFATPHGWVQRHTSPAGRAKDETLIAVNNLINKMNAAPLHYFVEVVTTAISNTANSTGNVAFRLCFNQPVTVVGTPSLRAIAPAGQTYANVNLVYDSTQSDPGAGKLVFANTAAALNVSVNSSATLVVNSTSTFTGANVNAAFGNTSQTVSATLATALSNSVTIVAYKPGLTAIANGASGSNTANANVAFTVQYNEAVTVVSNSSSPSILAISNHGASIANQTLIYSASDSNVANGTLVFKLTVDLHTVNAGFITFTINSTSTLTGFAGITDATGNVAQNTLGAFSNTQSF